VAEVYVGAVMRKFDGREVDGDRYFGRSGLVTLPRFERVERRGGVVKGGVPFEIDLTGEWDGGRRAWLVQVKYKRSPAGAEDVAHFLDQVAAVTAEKRYAQVERWYFCKQGYTTAAAERLREAGVLFSDREQFNALANLFGFFGLPE